MISAGRFLIRGHSCWLDAGWVNERFGSDMMSEDDLKRSEEVFGFG